MASGLSIRGGMSSNVHIIRTTMELRHLRYFVAVVEWKGLREASRKLHVAQSAVSQTLANLESEIGTKLFTRSGRNIQLTPQGEVFYAESVRTLAQSQHAIEAARRAARGEVGQLSLGFSGAATYSFLPDLVRKYKARFPGVKLNLKEVTPLQQEAAFAQGSIDVGFTRPLPKELVGRFHSRLLVREPLLAAVPASRPIKGKRIKVEDLAQERFILYHREGFPGLFDSIIKLCNEQGFSPNIDDEPDMMQTALSLVAAEQGISIVPTCALNLRFDGVQLLRIQPDYVRADLYISWPKAFKSTVLQSFLDLVEESKNEIASKAHANRKALSL
jgi:DNA-binding transcriptional LysR family regulator